MPGTLVSINVSQGGVPKRPVAEARVGASGLAGDAQRWEHHGGPLRAVCLWSLERIEALRAEGHAVEPGAAGENLTVAGIDWDRVGPGAVLRVGEVRLRVTDYTKPCRKIAACFTGGDFDRIAQARHPGWSRVYASVLEGGTIRAGDPVELVGERSGAHS
jgi:MOSC domain-containing protein YiiM